MHTIHLNVGIVDRGNLKKKKNPEKYDVSQQNLYTQFIKRNTI